MPIRLCFNLDLPEQDLWVVGRRRQVRGNGRLVAADMRGRSLVGYEGREYRRFFPLIVCLEALSKINAWQYKRYEMMGGKLASIYDADVAHKVYYHQEPQKEEEWLDVPHILKQGFGDCEDLACARVGELRYQGIPAVPVIKAKRFDTKDGVVTVVHVMVLHPDGSIEDPSKQLGMKGEM